MVWSEVRIAKMKRVPALSGNLGVAFIGPADGLVVGGIRDDSLVSGPGHLLRW